MREIAVELAQHLGADLKGAQVGEGAFKQTYKIVLNDGTTRALKLFHSDKIDDRVLREADALLKCTSPFVVKLDALDRFTSSSGQEVIFSTEEFLSGGSLEEHLAGGLLDHSQVASLALPLLQALSHTESQRLVHRDLKPANIMLRVKGDVSTAVLVDFGLVRDLDASSLTKTWLAHGPGTPLFAPPEQLNNEKAQIDWRSDQFSLGVTLTMAATGRHPYQEGEVVTAQTIDRVAARQAVAKWFIVWAEANTLEFLVRMVQPWSIRRYRTPKAALNALPSKEGL